MRILVAGGAGLLGAAVARRVALSGATTYLADIFDSTGDGRAVKEERASEVQRVSGAIVLRTDLANAEEVEALFAEHRPDVVVNAARFTDDGVGAVPLLEVAAAAHVEYFLHLSDAALYPVSPDPTRRAREDEPLDAAGTPGLERRLEDERHLASTGIPHAVMRVFELVGPSLPPSRFPMEALEAVLAGEEVFLPDDSPRDYLHVTDAVRGVEAALTKRPRRALNLGSGIATAPSAFVTALAGHAGRSASIRILTDGLPPRPPRIADMEAIHETLGFSPTKTLDDLADEIVWTRLAPAGTTARTAARIPPSRETVSAPLPDEPPKPVSRRELFDLFRRPFSGRRS